MKPQIRSRSEHRGTETLTEPGSHAVLTETLPAHDTGPRQESAHQLRAVVFGALRLEVDGAEWFITAEQAAWVRAGVRHRWRASGPVEARSVLFSTQLRLVPEDSVVAFALPAVGRELLAHGARHAAGPWTRPFLETLGGLAADWAQRPLPTRLPRPQSPTLERAMSYTREHLAENLTLEAVALAASTSTRTLARRFQEETQLTWRRYLQDARLIRAMELLAEPGARVTETASAVGFDSPEGFSRAFEIFSGEKPKDYRRRVARAR